MKSVYNTSNHDISIFDGGNIEKRQFLYNKLSRKRKQVEKQGALVSDGILIKTDEGSIAKITSTIMSLQAGLVETVNWKGHNGWIKNCDLSKMMEIAMAVTGHIEKAFTVESEIASMIEAMSVEELETLDIESV